MDIAEGLARRGLEARGDLKPQQIIDQNFPYGRQWSAKFFLLKWTVLELTTDQMNYPRHLSHSVFPVLLCATGLLYGHINPGDDYEIKDVVHQSRKCREPAFKGCFTGRLGDMRVCEEIYPLLD